MSSCKSVFSAFPRHFAHSPAGLALVVGASAAIASARQTTDFVSLTPQGTLPLTGASGSVASFGLCADGSVIAFHSFASDVTAQAGERTELDVSIVLYDGDITFDDPSAAGAALYLRSLATMRDQEPQVSLNVRVDDDGRLRLPAGRYEVSGNNLDGGFEVVPSTAKLPR